MPQSKEVHKEYMRQRRGSQTKGSQTEGAQNLTSFPESSTESVTSRTRETIPIKQIKETLPDSLVNQIERLSEWGILHNRPTTLEDRLRLAYKYHVWHEENFIGGIHRGAKDAIN